MNKHTHLSKNITDVTFNELLRQLEYKSKAKGKYFYKISQYYPSSQICSICNNKNSIYKNLNERTYSCKKCHCTMDRDLNASINIMFEGLKKHIQEMHTSFP